MKIKENIFYPVNCIFLLLFLLTIVGCEKERVRIDDYLVEFATVAKQGSIYNFRLDNGIVLTPQESIKFNGNSGDRVILNWTPSVDNIVKFNNISPIFTGELQTEGYPQQYKNDPVKIQSVWVGGDYLNMILEIEYHSVLHSINIIQDMQSETVDLYFAHSTNKDPRGYPKIMYSSFKLSSLRNQSENNETPFNLFINTHDGLRRFTMNLK